MRRLLFMFNALFYLLKISPWRWNKEYKLLKENKRKKNAEKDTLAIIKRINIKEFKKLKKRAKNNP